MLRRLAGGTAAVRSLPAAAAAVRRMLHIGGRGGAGAEEPESVAYRMSMLRRPSSVGKRGLIWNWCSLIGRLDAPVQPYDGSSDEKPGAYTFLSVSHSSPASSSSSSKFTIGVDFALQYVPVSMKNLNRVTLQLKGQLANVSLKHLKLNDLVFIDVKELNYVLDQTKKLQDVEGPVHSSLMPSATSQMLKENKYIDRLRLWQVFFANPYEWWDNRQSKPSARISV
nr:unnamed protein product [Digitaria exilis]